MSDKLEWLNQHFILLKYNTMAELTRLGGYELPVKYRPLCTPEMFVPDFMRKLVEANCIRAAVDVLACAMHHRAGVWWGVCCQQALYDEPEPAEASGEAPKPEEEKEEEKEPEAPKADDYDPDAEIAAANVAVTAKIAEVKSKFTPEQKALYDEIWQRVDAEFVKATGMPAMQFIESVTLPEEPEKEEEKEPEDEEEASESEQENAGEPPEDLSDAPLPEEMRLQLARQAFEAAKLWVLEPNEEHTLLADQAAAAIDDAPEGILARTAFWSYGNLAVTADDGSNVPVPAGLAANGLRTALLAMMLADGGSKSPRERAEQYLALGVEIACGRNNWLVSDSGTVAGNTGKKESETHSEEVYRKWK